MGEELAQAQRHRGSRRGLRPAGRGRGRRRARSDGRARAPARARGAARSPPAAPSRPASAGLRRRRSRSCRCSPRPASSAPTRGGAWGSASRRRRHRCRRPLREAAQGHRPPGQVGHHRRRDLGVVVDDLALCEAGLRVEDLVEVGEFELTPVDLDLLARGHGLLGGLGFGAFLRRGFFWRRLLRFFAAGLRLRAACRRACPARRRCSPPAPPSGRAPWSPRAPRLGGATTSSPAALRSIIASSSSRYSSR